MSDAALNVTEYPGKCADGYAVAAGAAHARDAGSKWVVSQNAGDGGSLGMHVDDCVSGSEFVSGTWSQSSW